MCYNGGKFDFRCWLVIMIQMKKALITGITGQDGSYLAELLLSKGYEVHGVVRRSSSYTIGSDVGEFSEIFQNSNLKLHYSDLSDSSSIGRIIKTIEPDEVYNLGAMSDVKVSFDIPEYTSDVTGIGPLRILEGVRNAGLGKTRIYQASSSEVYGLVQAIPQNEETPFYPRSPYAVSKVFAHWICKNYRESYGMFISSGILFNHESPRRGPNFVTRKITRGVSNILLGQQKKIYLGNLNAKRDWGYAPEYVEAMWKMLQQDIPDDYVIATGETHTVKEFLEEVFSLANLNPDEYVEIKKELFRPAEADILVGDATKANKVLGWEPKVKFKELVKILFEADYELAKIEYDKRK